MDHFDSEPWSTYQAKLSSSTVPCNRRACRAERKRGRCGGDDGGGGAGGGGGGSGLGVVGVLGKRGVDVDDDDGVFGK